MAHFAELDKDNKVIRVLVFDNKDVDANGGDQSEQAAEHIKSMIPLSKTGVKWVQTSYNNNFRKQYAGRGFTYDPEDDVFIAPQPFPSWSLNETTHDWEAPVAFPSSQSHNGIELGCFWDESGRVWMARDENNNEYTWDHSNSVWIPS
tara:strand:+ start:718 stop:1161 length:444 start_codon:yes stop_codon:yes gene_type:complete